MSHINRSMESQDNRNDGDGEQVLIAQPLSQAEIDELLYSDAYPREERLARLREMRAELSDQEASDFGSDDPGALLGQILEAIAQLEDGVGEPMDPAAVDHNAEDHRETLSPDSDELADIKQADQDSLSDPADGDEVLDEAEWVDEGDGFDTTKGVH